MAFLEFLFFVGTFNKDNKKRTLKRHGASVERRGAGERSRARLHGICCGSETPLCGNLRAAHDLDEPSTSIMHIVADVLLGHKESTYVLYNLISIGFVHSTVCEGYCTLPSGMPG